MTQYGTSTCGTTFGWPALTCPQVWEDGKQSMVHHKKKVAVLCSVVLHHFKLSRRDASDSLMTPGKKLYLF